MLNQLEQHVCYLFEKYCSTVVFTMSTIRGIPRNAGRSDAAATALRCGTLSGEFDAKLVKCRRFQRHEQRSLKR